MRCFIISDVGKVTDVIARGSERFGLEEQKRLRKENIKLRKRTDLSHRSEETIRGPRIMAVEVLDELMPDVDFNGTGPYEVHAVSRRRAAYYFTRRPANLTITEHVLRLGLVRPILVAGEDTIVIRKTGSIDSLSDVIAVPTSLENQNLGCRILRESAGED
jgi:hypothetical protein